MDDSGVQHGGGHTSPGDPVEDLWQRLDAVHADRGHPSLRAVEKATGLPRSTVSGWYRRRTVPDWERFRLLLDFYGESEPHWRKQWQVAYSAGTGRAPRDDQPHDGTRRPRGRRLGAPAVTVAAVLVVLLGIAAIVLTVHDRVGDQEAPPEPRTVCARDLIVRDSPRRLAEGARVLGVLYAGDDFTVQDDSTNRTYAYGFAGGGVRREGWVDVQWLCP